VSATNGHELVVGHVDRKAGIQVVNLEQCRLWAASAVVEPVRALVPVARKDALAGATPGAG
jgi:hypothetical protein